jgi:hypothetical protein
VRKWCWIAAVVLAAVGELLKEDPKTEPAEVEPSYLFLPYY